MLRRVFSFTLRVLYIWGDSPSYKLERRPGGGVPTAGLGTFAENNDDGDDDDNNNNSNSNNNNVQQPGNNM
jgi:hypothetical protein